MHNAHLAMARAAREALKLEKILFMPTGVPRYRAPAAASGEQRVAMLKLALGEEPAYEVDARELVPGASGYTYDTLKELRLEYGAGTELWLLMGADQYAKLGSWHRPDDIRKLASIAVFARPRFPVEKGARVVAMVSMPISASDIRARVARGEDISALVPAEVADYVSRHGLYA